MKSKKIIEINPYYVYIIAFTIPFLLYFLDWSYLMIDLSISLLLFFAITFCIFFIAGRKITQSRDLSFRPVSKSKINVKKTVKLICIGYVLEFIYSKQIPLISILKNLEVDYQNFGIPTFHVILTTFASFITIHIFTLYLSQKNKEYIFYLILLLLLPLLIVSRGTILLNLSGMFFVFLSVRRKKRLMIYAKVLAIIIGILFAFGYVGNLRTSNQQDRDKTMVANEIILNIAEVKPSFEKSSVPKEYFWAYLYICSPLANLQKTVDAPIKGEDHLSTILYYFNSEIVPDFISKRIFVFLDYKPLWITQVAPFLTVGTVYGKSYSYLGWFGMILTAMFLFALIYLYLKKLKRSNEYFSTGLAILNCIILYSIFDNMWGFSALSFQLIYPLLLPKFQKNK